MKTRRILAASTAALLAFGMTAIVASAEGEAAIPDASSDFTNISDMKVDTYEELDDGIEVKVSKTAQNTLKNYALSGATGVAGTMAEVFDKDGVLTGGPFESLEGTSLKKAKKAIKLSDDKSDLKSDFKTKKIQIFDVTVGWNDDNDEVPVDDIKLKANVTVRLTTAFKGNVYHLSSDGKTLEKVDAKVTTNAAKDEYYYTFESNKFSPYVVADVSIDGLSTIGKAGATDADDLVDSTATSDADAATSNGEATTNPETGIALAIAPVVLAAGAVAVVALKKKH